MTSKKLMIGAASIHVHDEVSELHTTQTEGATSGESYTPTNNM